ncbi:MFS transporter [Actinoplanes palleronii]|uniref:MFS transporter n=1 Tax=Actinoplanes palleronii TaxID=113570 RepID=A0ABQ4BNI7_9ACTN|nr:MFS transporter [Actinoplanes palleronii]GIE72242.1 MFS transporter [Actinoplanes palleronii]
MTTATGLTTPGHVRRPRVGLLTLTAAAFLSVTTEMLPTGLLPAIGESFDVPVSRVGLLVTAYAVMVAVFAASIGAATVRIPRRRLLTLALVGYAITNGVTAIAGTFGVALAARVAGGIVHGLFWAIAAGYAARLVPPDRIGRAATFVFAGGTVAFVAGVPAGTSLGELVGWRTAFGVFAVLFALLAVAVRWLLPALPGAQAGSVVRLRTVLRLPGIATVVATTVVINLGFYTFYTYVAPFLRQAGVSETAIGPALLVYGVANGVGLFLAGVIVDRRPRSGIVTSVSLLIAALVLASVAGSSVPALLALAVCGLAGGTMPVFLQAAALRVAPAAPDAASGLTAAAFNVGIGGGALLGSATIGMAGVPGLPVAGALLAAAALAIVVSGSRLAFPPRPA